MRLLCHMREMIPGSKPYGIGFFLIKNTFCNSLKKIQRYFLLSSIQSAIWYERQLNSYLNNGINRTGFLTEATVDTLGHINVIACGSPAAISSGLSFNSDGLFITERKEAKKDRMLHLNKAD